MAHARKTDPQTSHDAGASVRNVTKTQEYILKALKRPRSDEELLEAYRAQKMAPMASDPGIRTRRKELVDMGLVKAVGVGLTKSNRKTTIWKAK